MPIALITGPANAGKARAVLDAVRARAARGEDLLLVVPTHADVERYRRELAEDGLVLGVRVERFQGLLAEVMRRAGVAGRRNLTATARTGARERRRAHVLAPRARRVAPASCGRSPHWWGNWRCSASRRPRLRRALRECRMGRRGRATARRCDAGRH